MVLRNSPTETLTDPTIRADEESVMNAFLSGTPVDPDVARRVQERSRRIREDVFRNHGLVDVAVPAIRELRGPVS